MVSIVEAVSKSGKYASSLVVFFVQAAACIGSESAASSAMRW